MRGFRNTFIAIAGWWLLLALGHATLVHHAGFSWKQAFSEGVVSNMLLALLSLAPVNTFRYYRPNPRSVFSLLLWIALPSLLYAWLSPIFLQFFSYDVDYALFVQKTKWLRIAAGFLCSGCLVLMMWVWQTLLQREEMSARQQEAEKLARETELRSLRNQLQPHFLFNSLNSISALAGSRPEEARNMIQTLSDFLRSTLAKDENTYSPLSEELRQLELYLDIEKVRFGHRLKVRVSVAENCLSLKVPALIVQPVLENAIKFGLYGNIGEVEIILNAQVEGQCLKLSISNPYEKGGSTTAQGTGFGLSSMERRLYLLYGRRDLLSTTEENGLFTTQMIIPQNQS